MYFDLASPGSIRCSIARTDVRPIPVHLRRGEMNQAESALFLQTNDILGADCIGSPHAFVEVLTIPTPELCSCVKHMVERSGGRSLLNLRSD